MHDPKAVMRSLPLVASVLGRKYGVKVEIGGQVAYTDGKAIHLPSLPLDAPEILVNLARGYIDHESAHLRETDFGALKEAELTPLEMHIWNTIEDWRVENRLAALFPGCRQNFNWLIKYLFGSENAADATSNPALHVLNWLLMTVRSWDVPALAFQRDDLAWLIDGYFPGLRIQMEFILDAVRAGCRSTGDGFAYAKQLAALLAQESEQPSQTTKPGGSGQAEDSGQDDGETDPDDARKCLRDLLHADTDSLPKEMGSILAEALGQMIPDNPDQCVTVATPRPKPTFPLSNDELKEVRQASVALKTRLLGLLQTTTLVRNHTGRRGKLDTHRLHLIATADPRVFRRRGTRQGIDTAAHILLDCSSSMAQQLQLATKACFAVAKALKSCAINVALTAFPAGFVQDDHGGKGSWATIGQIIRHGERVHERVLVRPVGSTPMGEALWWVLQDMLLLSEKRKLILILTDGEPDSVPCMLDATEQANRLGMEVYGIGIGSTGIESLLPGKARSISSLGDLAPAMFEMLQGALMRR
ncbi:VWA domain-containing protein [Desulfocurvibacter africanus]|uniref:VWA domain-containing protein n=1 Tax=Desulfocurvibacter africanus TaxID=873 RepID=UPI00040C3DE3|nr:VWA domain-containing protein [Desulfocurvibacter africanus]